MNAAKSKIADLKDPSQSGSLKGMMGADSYMFYKYGDSLKLPKKHINDAKSQAKKSPLMQAIISKMKLYLSSDMAPPSKLKSTQIKQAEAEQDPDLSDLFTSIREEKESLESLDKNHSLAIQEIQDGIHEHQESE